MDNNRRWVILTLLTCLVLGVILGYGAWARSAQAAADQRVVDASDLLVAQKVANATIAADSQLAKLCPKGWNDACAGTLPPAANPVCTTVTVVPASATAASATSISGLVMDNACQAAAIRVKMEEIAADQSKVTRPEQIALGWKSYQEEMFAEDSPRIDLLKFDRRLSREVILKHWTDPGMGYTILAHPSLTPADCAQIYGVIQANGWYYLMPGLLINPNLDPGIKGMWIARPEQDPAKREKTILLGLHQPSVAAGMIHYLVDQAIEDANAGNFSLWNILLKAAANGDLPVNRCHLATDKSDERKTFPVCGDATGWDFVEQMKEAAEASFAAGSPFPVPPESWDTLHKSCEWETMAGRHSGGSQGAASIVVPKMEDVRPVTASVPTSP